MEFKCTLYPCYITRFFSPLCRVSTDFISDLVYYYIFQVCNISSTSINYIIIGIIARAYYIMYIYIYTLRTLLGEGWKDFAAATANQR